jgi:hypothetical protein
MRSRIVSLFLGLALLFTGSKSQAQVNVTIGWAASPGPSLAGYYVAYGTNSGVYFATNTYPPNQTAGVVTGLSYNTVYYFAVAAFSSNGTVSPFSKETMYSNNAPPVVTTTPTLPGGGPPPPPMPGTTPTTPGGRRPAPSTGGGGVASGAPTGSGGSGSTSQGPSAASTSTNITQAQVWGVPPVLGAAMSNGQPVLTIAGTIGSTVLVEGTTNLSGTAAWTVLTNVYMTNPAPVASSSTPGQAQDAIDLAYTPAIQSIPLPASTNGAIQHFRGVLAYDYVILAGLVLPTKGYASRLIMVNMPGVTDDGCYVTQAHSFIHYNYTNSALQLIPSGSTIRQIATTLANTLNLDWTTASEFTYSNGVGQILATVVEADPASSDPVAGQTPTSSIVINF